MLRRVLNWLVLVPIAVVLIVLSVANRTPVILSLDPLARAASPLSVSVPLFAVIILSMIVGVVIGGAAVWWKQGRYRKRCRKAESELSAVREDADRLRAELTRNADGAAGGPLAFLSRPAA